MVNYFDDYYIERLPNYLELILKKNPEFKKEKLVEEILNPLMTEISNLPEMREIFDEGLEKFPDKLAQRMFKLLVSNKIDFIRPCIGKTIAIKFEEMKEKYLAIKGV